MNEKKYKKDCLSRYQIEKDKKDVAVFMEQNRIAMHEKQCSRCNQTLPVFAFGVDRASKDDLSRVCKVCLKEITAEYWKRKPELMAEYSRKYLMKRLYNITLADYDAMFEDQGGVCAICGLPEIRRRLCVDHNHATGEVRGLLCTICNLAVGTAETNDMTRVLAYIESYNKNKEAV